MFGICDNCEHLVMMVDGEVYCALDHKIVKDRKDCDDYVDYGSISGEGTWSLD